MHELPTVAPFARVAVGSVSAMYMLCSGVQPKEKTMPKGKMGVYMVVTYDVHGSYGPGHAQSEGL